TTKKIEAMRGYFLNMLNNGIRDLIEFREGGIEGLSLIREAVGLFGDAVKAKVMARPAERRFDEDELDRLLTDSDGIGVSSYRDWEEDELIKVAEAARDMEKPFAMHCSEDEREPIGKILDMDVHHLVHMLEADMDDLEACADMGVPIVICPRSNIYFNKMPDIPMMLRSGVTLAMGTDNAMLADPDMFKEMKSAYRVAKKNGGVPAIEILKMATLNPRKALNYPYDIQVHQDADHYLIMEPCQGDTGYELVTRSSAKEIKEIVEW
ncbi:MAG: amidohydrolase family protein, partial [Thermoplasmatota archaeon]